MCADKATRSYQDVSELLQTGEPVVLAVDQVPFEVESRGVKNTFCLLVPLLTNTGQEINREQFRNRERVWWMLRPEIDATQIQVGSVWSGPIERSRAYGNAEREKDHYQVRRAEIRPGARGLVEVLNLNVAHPDLTDILSPEGILWPYAPLPRVIIRGGFSVVGPFRSSYNIHTGRVRLASLTDDHPFVYRLTQAEFEGNAHLREYSYQANQWDAKAQEREIQLTFIDEGDLDLFRGKGDQLDGATDSQVMNWALEYLEISEDERRAFRALFEKLAKRDADLDGDETKDRLSRFRSLCQNRQRVVELGSDIARAVAKHEAFEKLVRAHIDEITESSVADAIASRKTEVEASTADAEARLRTLEERADGLDAEYAERRAAWEEEFTREHGDRAARLDDQEKTLVRQEAEMKERLEHLVSLYRDTSGGFADQLVGQLLVMEKLGVVRSGGGSPVHPAAPAPTGAAPTGTLEFPPYLAVERGCSKERGPDEERFLSQFRSVVERHGFVFDDDDLVNFHVLMKTGLWTVLAGPSGLGKSSLPRFYAEALGCLEEYLLVPVRPDWLDDHDVMGAYNAISGRYESAPSGLVDRLICAHEDERRGRGGIYIVCIDEMNLARVEHYFAQFLSVLEQPEDERSLHLFARGVADPRDPYAPYRRLPIGANVRFVGTVNVDETTHFFSPKVIDRVSIAHFERPDLRQGLEQEDYVHDLPPIDPVHRDRYLTWVEDPVREGEAVELIIKTEEILRRSRCGLGFRVRDRILRYVASGRRFLGDDRAIDFAFVQNVLPLLRPIAPRYMELLKDMLGLFPESRFRRTSQLLHTLEEDPESDFFQLL